MTRRPLRPLSLASMVMLVAVTALPMPAVGDEPGDAGLVPMFPRASFDGWKKVGGGATYAFEDGQIIGRVGPGANTFLRTDRTYGDFLLKLDLKLDIPGNSGIQFRSHQQPSTDGNGRVYGYQCEVDPSSRAWSGGLYDEGRRGWLFPLEGHDEAQKAFKTEGWNRYTILARGPHLMTWVNGVPCADLLDAKDLEGFIALQVHQGKAGQIRWKDVRIKELGRSEWKPLWDGKTLSGWGTIGGGEWTIADGAIRGVSPASEARHGLLITDASYSDFAVRLKFQDKKGNSGLYFRCEPGGSAGVLGLQAEIVDTPDDLGGLYETGGRGWLSRPSKEETTPTKGAARKKAAAKKAETSRDPWTELAVIALGNRVVVQVDGKTTAELRDDQGRRSGRIALQLHGGQEMDVRFKEIEILPLDESKDRP
jgi:hypothetical protein